MATGRRGRILTCFEQIRTVLVEEFGCAPSDVKMTTSLRGELGLDSMDTAQLILDLEEVLGVEIPEYDAGKLFTVGDVVKYAEAHVDPKSHVA
jgi:acyl carrier protein